MEKHLLSKSSFVKGKQCVKQLFLYKYRYELRDAPDAERQAIFGRGHEVGKLAWQLFPGGTDASPGFRRKQQDAVNKTRKLIDSGCRVIYEASVQYDGVLVIVDILVCEGNQCHAYEVKSSLAISSTYLSDASLQHYVLKNAGIPLSGISLVTLNRNYRRSGKIDAKELFSINDVTQTAIASAQDIANDIAHYKAILNQPGVPDVATGSHCFFPYKCDFMGHCWGKLPADSILNLKGLGKNQRQELLDKGYKRIGDVVDLDGLSGDICFQIKKYKAGEVHVDRQAISSQLAGIVGPLAALDFEVLSAAVPWYEGTGPFEQIPFQFSITDESEKSSGFLAESGTDPRADFARNLLEKTKPYRSLLVFDSTMESHVLASLALTFPDLRPALDELRAKLIDLKPIFANRQYYHPEMMGAISLKDLSVTILKSSQYQALPVQSGLLASRAFEQLQTETDLFNIAKLRDDMEAYCAQDTITIMRLYHFLKSL